MDRKPTKMGVIRGLIVLAALFWCGWLHAATPTFGDFDPTQFNINPNLPPGSVKIALAISPTNITLNVFYTTNLFSTNILAETVNAVSNYFQTSFITNLYVSYSYITNLTVNYFQVTSNANIVGYVRDLNGISTNQTLYSPQIWTPFYFLSTNGPAQILFLDADNATILAGWDTNRSGFFGNGGGLTNLHVTGVVTNQVPATNVFSGGTLPIPTLPSTTLIWTNPPNKVKLANDLNGGTLYLGIEGSSSTNQIFANLYGNALNGPQPGDFFALNVSYFGSNEIPAAAFITLNPIDFVNRKNSESATFAIVGQNAMTNQDTVNWEYAGDASVGFQGTVQPLVANAGASVGAYGFANGSANIQGGAVGYVSGSKNNQTNIALMGSTAVNGVTGGRQVGVYAQVVTSTANDAAPNQSAGLEVDVGTTGYPLFVGTTNNGQNVSAIINNNGAATFHKINGLDTAAFVGDGQSLTNLTYQYTTNVTGNGIFAMGKEYFTNLTASRTLGTPTLNANYYESLSCFVTNSGASVFTLTCASGILGPPGSGNPAVFNFTNGANQWAWLYMEHHGAVVSAKVQYVAP